MKILSIGSDRQLFSPGSEVVERMRRYGTLVDEMHIIVFSLVKQKLIAAQLADNVWAYPTDSLNRVFCLWRAYRLGRKLLKEAGPWVITSQDPFAAGLVGWLLARSTGQSFHVQEHGDFFSAPYWRRESLFNFLSYWLGRFIIKRADSVRVVGARIAETLTHKLGIPVNKIVNVPVFVGVTAKTCPPRERAADNGYVFLTMARLVKQKNLPLLLRAFAGVCQSYPATKLIIVGAGPEKGQLTELIDHLGLVKNIDLHDWTSNAEYFYCSADAYVLSSDYEGWARVIVEAAAYGLPIIMTDVGCAGEFLKNQYNGLIVPLRDEKALREAMVNYLRDPNQARAYGALAKHSLTTLPDQMRTLDYYKKSWELALINKHG